MPSIMKNAPNDVSPTPISVNRAQLLIVVRSAFARRRLGRKEFRDFHSLCMSVSHIFE